MKINFILPHQIRIPMGGVKVVYKLAEHLASKGENVTIFVPNLIKGNLKNKIKSILFYIRDFFQGVQLDSYYSNSKNVNFRYIDKITGSTFKKDEVSIFVGVHSISYASIEIDELENGNYYLFIQGIESQNYFNSKIHSFWHSKIKKIIISKWLLEYIVKFEKISKKIGPINNAIDPNEFFLKKTINNRQPSILFCYHRNIEKGGLDAIKILKVIHKKFPNINIRMFCSRLVFKKIPDWIEVYIRPEISLLNSLYNDSMIFLHTSYKEGWGLPPMEAMACGCTIVGYRNKGIVEYARNNIDSLLTDIGDTNSCIENIIKLLNNESLRIRLANEGLITVSKFSFSDSAKVLLKGLYH